MKYFAYMAAACGLGLIWYCALLIPRVTRVMLQANGPLFVGAACVTGVALALAFRKQVIRAVSAEEITLLAVGVPTLAAVLTFSTMLIYERSTTPAGPETLAGTAATLLFVALGTPIVFPIVTCYVLLPVGLASVFVLRALGRVLWPEIMETAA